MSRPSASGGEITERLAATRLLALDVDGVLTDARVVYADDAEWQAFSVRDGQGLVWLREAGVVLVWITGRGCAATQRRAEELGVTEIHTRVAKKGAKLAEVQERLGIDVAETVAMGDDLPDLALAAHAGVFACPADADAEVRARAALVMTAPGGAGAVRELAERILRAKRLWQDLVARHAADSG
ncbi:MAG: HAD hydrolase family protein [Planctomycetota bacterium]|nr:HAD hydrolase family protein [Planctomycetota bacterium]